MDEVEKLQQQVVLLERIGEALDVLDKPSMRDNAQTILESVGGRFDLLLSPTTAQRAGSSVDPAAVAAAPPTTFPARVAVVSSDLTTRKLVAAAVTNGTRAELATFSTLAEAADDSAAVVVICTSQETPFVDPRDLPRPLPSGGRRGFVYVGEMEPAVQDAVHATGSGWCETVRARRARAPTPPQPAILT